MSKENLLYQQDDTRSVFRRYFPSGILIPLLPSDIHGLRIRYHLGINFLKGAQWDEHFAVRHPDESTTYVVAKYGDVADEGKPKVAQVGFLDVSRRGFIAGQSQMVFVEHPWLGEIVGEIWWTDTRRFMRRKGLGIRRLEVMNAFARVYHNAPLQSDGPTKAERGVWQKLVKQGKAKPLEDGEFVFL